MTIGTALTWQESRPGSGSSHSGQLYQNKVNPFVDPKCCFSVVNSALGACSCCTKERMPTDHTQQREALAVTQIASAVFISFSALMCSAVLSAALSVFPFPSILLFASIHPTIHPSLSSSPRPTNHIFPSFPSRINNTIPPVDCPRLEVATLFTSSTPTLVPHLFPCSPFKRIRGNPSTRPYLAMLLQPLLQQRHRAAGRLTKAL